MSNRISERWRTRLGFRSAVYAATFCSGAAGLIFQVVWQRYLSFLVGSEARSVSLVVAVFLFGLAAGYRYWGNITERNWSRQKLLKAVGFIELGIAIYGLLFPQLFGYAREIVYAGPDSLAFDLLVTLGLLFVPTFLMGATIPLLTAAIPATADEVNYCHSRIYGINTLGAFLGALLAGFYLVPQLGLLSALIVAAILDASVGILFLLNRLPGDMHKGEDVPEIPNAFGTWGIYLFVFTTGATSIGLEVLFVRLVSLSVGSGLYVFPIVVAIVVLGLAIGSLSLRKTGMNGRRVPRELIKICIILVVLYLTVPFWGFWINHARVSLTSIPSNYTVYLASILLFFSALILPLMIPMGRLLPVGYALIHKTRSDYGQMCGRVYFMNTLGTVVGAVVIGYVLFLWLDLQQIFKLTIAMLLGLSAFLWMREAARIWATVCVVAAIGVFFLPKWNRDLHCFSLFRIRSIENFHFTGVFVIPSRAWESETLLLRDDPNATVALMNVRAQRPEAGLQTVNSKAIAVNGKSDGDTIGDYSNMVLTGLLPYFYCPRSSELNVAVVGLGSGITSGALALGDDVRLVTTIEIASGVIEALPLIGKDNFHLSENPKSRIVQTDAFRFFARADQKFDIIVSEPSNPWVVGVENLFTPEFYRLVSQSLDEQGVFCQWVQMYSIDREILSAICQNVFSEFQHASLFVVGDHDLVILASQNRIDVPPHRSRRIGEPAIQRTMVPMAINDERLLNLIETHHEWALKAMTKANPSRVHSMELPWIGHAASKALFVGSQLKPGDYILTEIGRHLPVGQRRRAEFLSWMAENAGNVEMWCTPDQTRHSTQFICMRVQKLAEDMSSVAEPLDPLALLKRLQSYGRLREQSYIDANIPLLDELLAATIANQAQLPKDEHQRLAMLLAREFAYEWQWDRLDEVISKLADAKVLVPADVVTVRGQIEEYRDRVQQWMAMLEE